MSSEDNVRTNESAAGDPRWRQIAIGGGGGMFVAMGLGRFSYTAMVPALIGAGELTPVDAGRVGMVNFIGFLLGAVVSVRLSRYIGRRQTLGMAIALAVAGLGGSAMAPGFLWLAACRGVIGLSTGLIMVLSLALIAESAPVRQRAMAGSFVFAGVGLGICTSGVLVPALLGWLGLGPTWAALAVAGVAGSGVALWGWTAAPSTGPAAPPGQAALPALAGMPMKALLLAHALFSFGLVPHTLYWVDFLVRGLGLGMVTAGLHWSIVGLYAVLGPVGAAILARQVGTATALFMAFLLLGLGIAAPVINAGPFLLFASSILFGAQPGLSALMAARARDLGHAARMGEVMRAMILANGIGAAAGGFVIPRLYAETSSHAALFVTGGLAMIVAAVAVSPLVARSEAPGR